ncbi:thylakoid-associated protein [Fischerella sp. PCC 9605]|uniref:thylakoid-associated protein n=1 Tax=Fischerella sp. PCC 9605 TaxID=1173024 RepID=UPI0004B4902A|nr:thylakoid-associated protein [Fischerella sp. PCC 9605]
MPPHFLPKPARMGYLAVKRQMYTTYFDDYQKQFNEWQKQFSDWQKKFFDTLLESLPNVQGEVNPSQAFDQSLDFQAEIVKSFLEAQEKNNRMMLDAQKKFWEDYFERMRKKPAAASS